jgi:hypothetical protein
MPMRNERRDPKDDFANLDVSSYREEKFSELHRRGKRNDRTLALVLIPLSLFSISFGIFWGLGLIGNALVFLGAVGLIAGGKMLLGK